MTIQAAIRLEWAQYGDFDSFEIIRSSTSMANLENHELPEPIAVGLKTMFYLDTSITNGATYYYIVRTVRDDNAEISEESIAYTQYLWTPNLLQSLGAWYSADDNLNVVVNGLLDTLYDKTGKNAHAKIHGNNINNRAVIVDKGLNNLPFWKYNSGVEKAHFSTNDANIVSIGNDTDAISMYVVESLVNATSSGSTIVSLTTGTSDTSARMHIARGITGQNAVYTGGRRLDSDGNVIVGNSINHGVGWNIFGAINNYSQKKSEIYVNGTLSFASTNFLSEGNTSPTNSQYLHIGNTGTNINPHLGATAEVIICRGALTDSERLKIEGYLAYKWGLTSMLPSSHPYKQTPPAA